MLNSNTLPCVQKDHYSSVVYKQCLLVHVNMLQFTVDTRLMSLLGGRGPLVECKRFHVSALFQVRRMASGRAACPTSVERSCSKPSTTFWSAVSWTVALFASASGLSSRTRRRRRPLIKGTYPLSNSKVTWPAINSWIKGDARLMVGSQVAFSVMSLCYYLLCWCNKVVMPYSAMCRSDFPLTVPLIYLFLNLDWLYLSVSSHCWSVLTLSAAISQKEEAAWKAPMWTCWSDITLRDSESERRSDLNK